MSVGHFDAVIERVVSDFNKPRLSNRLRGHYVECLVEDLLAPAWWRVGSDWSSYDLERQDGCKIEVKQSAAVQSWHDLSTIKEKAKGSFSIKRNQRVRSETGRAADIYVFCWNPHVKDANHLDPQQWEFYVVPTQNLPEQKTIALSRVKQLANAVSANQLAASVVGALKNGVN